MRRMMDGDWVSLWEEKTGRTQPEDLSNHLAVQLGTHTEDFNLKWFEQERNVVLRNHQFEIQRNTDTGIPIKGTLDAMLDDAVVEAKHTNAFNDMDGVIERYMPQLQLYMWLANATQGAYLSVIFGNSKWESVHVQKDDNYIINLLAVIGDFWRHVVEDREPIGFDVPKVDITSIPIDNMVVRDASQDNHFVSLSADYINHMEAAKIHERTKKDLKNMVGDDEREVFCEYLTVKRDKRGALRITKRI